MSYSPAKILDVGGQRQQKASARDRGPQYIPAPPCAPLPIAAGTPRKMGEGGSAAVEISHRHRLPRQSGRAPTPAPLRTSLLSAPRSGAPTA